MFLPRFLMVSKGVRRQEVEYVQNMFDCICSLMLLKSNQIAFGNLQGPHRRRLSTSNGS